MKTLLRASLLPMGLLMLGCSARAGGEAPDPVLESRHFSQCPMPSNEAGQTLIESAQEWAVRLPFTSSEALFSRPLNWQEERVLFLSQGVRPNPGYRLELLNSRVEGHRLLLQLHEHQPAVGELTPQVISRPCLLLRLQKSAWSSIHITGDTSLNTLP